MKARHRLKQSGDVKAQAAYVALLRSSVTLTHAIFDVLLFNKSYARCLLRAHLVSIKEEHKKSLGANEKAQYVDVAGALGPLHDVSSGTHDTKEQNVDDAVEKLLPVFEAMLRYRNTVLKVKEMDLQQQIDIRAGSETGGMKRLKDSLKDVVAMGVADRGHLLLKE